MNWFVRNGTKIALTLIGAFATSCFAILIGYFAWVGVTASNALARDTYNEDRRALTRQIGKISNKIDAGFLAISNRFAGIDEKLAGMEEILKSHQTDCKDR